ncbi:MAG TPA: class II fumarate hydratase [Spongiibacteraceae bacterium]|nr:class II fumarate hydratase [Spongiibacteraceae bacterium]
MNNTRIEHDSMGEIAVPVSALYGAQTQRAIDNFAIAGRALPAAFIVAVAAIKRSAALVNAELGVLPPAVAQAIAAAADEVCAGVHATQFPVDVYQTGSGTSTNMNVNEVLAHLASRRCGSAVHANDHVNAGQSSNDVIPTALQLSALQQWQQHLAPALEQLRQAIAVRAHELRDVVKTGRTHLMDAMPIRLDQELSGWQQQIENARERLRDSAQRFGELPLGGTAVGTGINADPRFAIRVIERLAAQTHLPLRLCRNRFERMSSLDAALEFSGQLRVAATALIKICNDLRWMNSGPYSGLGEIQLAALQPGSSIMPGKVNPVIPEACAMAATQCIGLDAAIAAAAQSGNFQLNVMLPLVADNLLQMIALLARACRALSGRGGIADFRVARAALAAQAARNPMLITALAPEIGYELAAQIVKRALAEQRPIIEVAAEMSHIDKTRLAQLLNPLQLTEAGNTGGLNLI